jgi:hypothetical protein
MQPSFEPGEQRRPKFFSNLLLDRERGFEKKVADCPLVLAETILKSFRIQPLARRDTIPELPLE